MKREQLEQILLDVQKPAQYIGGELNSIMKDKEKVDCRLAFCFPDKYEVGMSHLGMKILYSLYNERENWWCERVFAPDADMEQLMREKNIPLYGLESLDPIRDFDFILFTMQYEMSYTAILNMLDLAGVPVRSKDRTALAPMVVAGGPCACNPEPVADFIDIFIIGEGEEVNIELTDLYMQAKKEGWDKQRFLQQAAQIGGVYVPSLYDVSYREDGTIDSVKPNCPQAPEKVTKRIIADLDKVYYPKQFVVPFINIVHDRSMLEIQRGCLRGCRFCQAGFIYRPLRDKHYDTLNADAHSLCDTSGYEELSLTSLSTSDYKEIEPLLDDRIPPIEIDYATVLDKALANSSFEIDNQIRQLNAEAAIAQAKSERGASATINARFGLSQTGDDFRTAYSNLLDQEVVGLQFSIPIFDWGMGKGRVRMAKAKAEMLHNQIEQDQIDYRHAVYTLIEQFYNQRNQCAVARKAREVADRRYAIAMENFRRGTISVTEMNTAQTEKDEANQTYVSAMAAFWNYYYSLRRKTLYDFISHTDINVEFDKLIAE